MTARAFAWLGVLLGGLLLAWAGGVFGVWQALDFAVYRRVYLADMPQPTGRIHVVDLPYDDQARQGRPQAFRERQAQALQALAAQEVPPRAVLLDVWIADQPDGAEALFAAAAALQKRGTRLLVAVEPKDRQGRLTGDFMKQHLARFYTEAADGFGHTQLHTRSGVLYFECRLRLPGAAGEMRLQALPLWVEGSGCTEGAVVIPMGDDAAWKPYTHRLDAAGRAFEPPLPQRGAPETVIVGSLREDSDNLLARPGPLLLAWALTDLGLGRDGVARRPLNHPAAGPALAALAVLATLAAYRLPFRVLRPRVAPLRWPALALLLMPAAWLAAAALLAVAAALVSLDRGPVVPVALPLAASAAAALWAWRGALRWIADARARAELEGAGEERAIAYDVFVSYAHDPPEHKAWVKQAVVAPLAALTHADGSPYRIFFDESAIKVGRGWKAEIELALLGTRCFVAVYSDRYFERPYCREEIELADQLRIEGRLRLFPVARTVTGIPERYGRKLQYIDARTDPAFAEQLCREVRAAVEAPGPSGFAAQ